MGEKDEDIFQDKIKELVVKIKSAGVLCELEMIPNAKHDDAPLYQKALENGLKFMS
jgi:hypothetical protein